jgi:catechol 2,3-dioxygenase-like lactoylglutathione lyase family enzyme
MVDLKLELVIIPVSDVDRAKDFYVGQVWFEADIGATRHMA